MEWAKQLVASAVRSPHTQQAYAYALEQFFVWAAGRAISRESVQGYVTWLGEMKFSPSTINQRLAAIRKLAAEAERCGYVDSETAQAIVSVAGVKQKGRRLGRWLAWVVNIIILWNTLYINAAFEQLASQGYAIHTEDIARLSPLVFEHINLLGRYAFSVPDSVVRGQLRSLRNPADALEDIA